MKIVIQHKARPNTGKGQFVLRLIPALKRAGCEVTGDIAEQADIALHIGRVKYKSRATKNVIRVGPACIDVNKKWGVINREKAKSVKACDAVVYQSSYSRDIYHTLVSRAKDLETVIFNGADPAWYKTFGVHESCFKYNILASTRKWIPQKRLGSIVESVKGMQDTRLWIAGETDYRSKDLSVKVLGNIGQERLARLYGLCDCMVHLTWVDACPNSVVEALVADCPVVCTNQGGTAELVKQNGIVVEDKPFKMRPVNLNKPPKINVRKEIEKILHEPLTFKAPPKWVYIDTIARQYIEFFTKVLYG